MDWALLNLPLAAAEQNGAPGWLLILAGLFVLAAVGFNWEWFFSHRKAQFFVDIFGRNGARIFYGLLGLVLLGLGCFLLMHEMGMM